MKCIYFSAYLCFFYTASAPLPLGLHESFNSTSDNWRIGESENYSMKMEGGKYVFTTRVKGPILNSDACI